MRGCGGNQNLWPGRLIESQDYNWRTSNNWQKLQKLEKNTIIGKNSNFWKNSNFGKKIFFILQNNNLKNGNFYDPYPKAYFCQ